MCDSTLEWTKVLVTIIAAVVAAAVTGFFAYRQHTVARAKLNLDLFEKRIVIFEHFHEAIEAHVCGCSTPKVERARLLLQADFERANFLFGVDTARFMQKASDALWLIYHGGGGQGSSQTKQQDQSKAHEEEGTFRDESAAREWLAQTRGQFLRDHFLAYLDFKAWT